MSRRMRAVLTVPFMMSPGLSEPAALPLAAIYPLPSGRGTPSSPPLPQLRANVPWLGKRSPRPVSRPFCSGGTFLVPTPRDVAQ
ncbi:hypothetical protein FKM82_025869 [Ascaphus truei]